MKYVKTLLTAGLLLCFSAATMAALDNDILDLQQRWASTNYSMSGDEQGKAFATLTADARKLVQDNPDRAEPLVWLAIILSSDAGATGGISALGKVKEARGLLERAEQIDAGVLNGSVYTSLGSLYYQVPGWPIGFGNDAKAELYLHKALAINPDGIDPNYFYGDFLLEEGKPAEAIRFLEKAQVAPPRPDRVTADKGRQDEIARKLQLARSKL
jgi:tetratricopeptide (TPR) repeat protein